MIARKIALVILFAAGILSIMATSRLSEFHFSEVDVDPLYRCPGDDVAVRWSLSKAAPVTVTIDQETVLHGSGDEVTLPASLLDQRPPVAELALRIEATETDWPRSYHIMTLDGARAAEVLAFHHRKMDFLTHQSGSWSDRARIVKIEVRQIRSFTCANGATSPPAWEVIPPGGPSFELTEEQSYTVTSDPAPHAGGEWRFRPKGGDCRLPKEGLEPYLEVHLTAMCVANKSGS